MVHGELVHGILSSPSHASMLTVACFFPSDCHLFVYCVEDAVASMMSEVANIDVGLEPVAFCVISPDGKVVLSCDDDGQLETWSTSKGTYPSLWLACVPIPRYSLTAPGCSVFLCLYAALMLLRYETGHASVLATFAMAGACIVSCADFECELVVLDVETAEILVTETFPGLEEGRNKAGYAMGPGGNRVRPAG